MITWRNYIATVMLILVLMFLLIASSALRDQWNNYDINVYTGTSGEKLTEVNTVWLNDAGRSSAGSAVLIGSTASEYGKAAKEWALYSRRDFDSYSSLKDYADASQSSAKPEMLIIDSAAVDWQTGDDVQSLIDYSAQGINLIFCTLPDASVIKNNARLRDFLGISEVAAEQKEADGIYLYSGFLLGGEIVYQPPENPAESAVEQFVFPGDISENGKPVFDWYLPGPGTKVYMRGIPEDEDAEPGEYPALIWRKSLGASYLFAVNGGYMNGSDAIGILSAMAAEMNPYEIYPIVNAQSMALINYPNLADENREEIERLYSRSIQYVHQEIIWPGIFKATQPYGYKITCMLSPRLNYSEDAALDAEQFDYYLKIFHESSTEAGLSLISGSNVSGAEKAEEDARFFKENSNYEFTSVYSGNLSDAEIEGALNNEFLSSVETALADFREKNIIDLLSGGVIIQTAFDADFNYTYAADFSQRCMDTALGYCNVLYDMTQVTYPRTEDDTWDKLYAEFKTSVDGYGGILPVFDKTNVSESGERVKTFLTAQYRDSREGDTIELEIKGDKNSKWFILRTHNEIVVGADGAGYTQIEEGAYLIETVDDNVRIYLDSTDALLRPSQP